jgi:hypothetical protein
MDKLTVGKESSSHAIAIRCCWESASGHSLQSYRGLKLPFVRCAPNSEQKFATRRNDAKCQKATTHRNKLGHRVTLLDRQSSDAKE